MKKFNVYNAIKPIYDLASSADLPDEFKPVYGEGREHYDMNNACELFTQENHVFWSIGLLKGNGKLIRIFNQTRKEINHAFLNNNPSEAIRLLDELNGLCKSWWAIQLKLHILKEFNIEDTRSYLDNLPLKFSNADISTKVNDLKLISESSSYEVFLREFLLRMAEYRISGVTSAINFGAIESIKYIPTHLDSNRNVTLDLIGHEYFESLIDQYVFIKELLLEKDTISALTEFTKSILYELAEEVDDDEMKNLLIEEIEPKPIIKKIIMDYTNGNYVKVIKDIDDLRKVTTSDYIGLIELYSRAKIYTGQVVSTNSLFEKLVASFIGILQCEKNTIENIDFLKRISFKFKLESWAKSINFHLLSTLEEICDSNHIELSRKQTKVLGQLNTFKATVKSYRPQIFNLDGSVIPLHRLLKYTDDKFEISSVDNNLIPIKSDFIKIQCRYYVENKRYVEAIDFCIKNYLLNQFTALYLPIASLCKLVNDLVKEDNGTYISCIVIYDIMARAINNNFEEMKADLFEEFMDINNTHKPSEIFNYSVFSEKEIYFLRYICIPSQLDNFTQYISNDDVIHERITILDILINNRVEGSEQLKKEKDSILETLFSEKLRAKIESGKLYVDVHALTNKRKHLYISLYEQAIELKGGIHLEPLKEDDNINSVDIFQTPEGNAVASSRKMEMLFTIFRHIVNDFALNENYGLDKYLSAEIRHIVFTTQIRSCFEKTKLVTIKKDGKYLSNEYWVNKYKYVNSHIVNQFDHALSLFSESIDSILQRTNESFRVEITNLNSKNVFNYIAYHHRLVRVSEIITSAADADDFYNSLLEFMWEITAENARKAQHIINDELAREINRELDNLEEKINNVKRDAAIVELTQEIKHARTLFKNDIELVLNWFRFVGADDKSNLEKLNVVLDATLSSFEDIYGYKYKALVENTISDDLFLNYRESKALFISVFTALENACKYTQRNHPPHISFNSLDGVTTINIINKVDDFDELNALELVEREKKKWNERHSELNIKEGGTGLYKIYSTLKNASVGFKFDINVKDDMFISSIGLKNEYFNNRR